MSIQSEIDRINDNVASTYTALSEMGATMPETQNSDNLPGTVRTVPTGGGSKTVQTDWNQTDETAPDFLKNKPFCDFPTGGDTISWNGAEIDWSEGEYKISDTPFTAADIANGVIANIELMGQHTTIECYVVEASDNAVVLSYDIALIVSAIVPGELPVGVWVVPGDGLEDCAVDLTINGYTGFPSVKKMDEKYLPEGTETIFYHNIDELAPCYLYTDMSCTVKATFAELGDAVASDSFRVMKAKNDGALDKSPVIYNMTGDYSGSYNYGYLVVVDHMEENMPVYKTLYTAEYTPK